MSGSPNKWNVEHGSGSRRLSFTFLQTGHVCPSSILQTPSNTCRGPVVAKARWFMWVGSSPFQKPAHRGLQGRSFLQRPLDLRQGLGPVLWPQHSRGTATPREMEGLARGSREVPGIFGWVSGWGLLKSTRTSECLLSKLYIGQYRSSSSSGW